MKKVLGITFSLFMLVVLLAGAVALVMLHSLHNETVTLDEPMVFNVKSGDSLHRISRRLAEQKVIDSPAMWNLYGKLQGGARNIQVGCYQITPESTPAELLTKFTQGDVIRHKVTVVEGRNFREIRAKLAAEPQLEATITGMTDAQVMAQLGHAREHPEGRFFPATYDYSCNAKDIDVLQRAYDKMSRTIASVWAERQAGLPYKNAYEALTMASIIEKETAVGAERREISGVFVRRLQKGMKLQTDPTIIYGMGERYQGNITRADIREATPYNTYVIKGLPPTPIAMPGLAAMEAAVNPKPGDSLFFVSRGDGTHKFSATYAEHQAAVKKYQLGGE